MSGYTITYYSTELTHHGIKGQRWGRRRWQNEDGSLTEEGQARYGSVENFERAQRRKKIIAGVAVTAAVVGGGIYLYSKGKKAGMADNSLAEKGKSLIDKSLSKAGDNVPNNSLADDGKKKVEGVFKADNFKNAGKREDYNFSKGQHIKSASLKLKDTPEGANGKVVPINKDKDKLKDAVASKEAKDAAKSVVPWTKDGKGESSAAKEAIKSALPSWTKDGKGSASSTVSKAAEAVKSASSEKKMSISDIAKYKSEGKSSNELLSNAYKNVKNVNSSGNVTKYANMLGSKTSGAKKLSDAISEHQSYSKNLNSNKSISNYANMGAKIIQKVDTSKASNITMSSKSSRVNSVIAKVGKNIVKVTTTVKKSSGVKDAGKSISSVTSELLKKNGNTINSLAKAKIKG